MKSIEEISRRRPEFAERRPDLPPLPPAREPREIPRWAMPAASAVFCVGWLLAALWANRRGERLQAERMLEVLTYAVHSYEAESGGPPPGDGAGSAELVKALQGSYFEFQPEQIDDQGHAIVSGRRVLYRGPLLGEGPSFELRVWAGGEWVEAPGPD